MVDSLSLYFHIPFCKKKCGYCHFYVIPENEAQKDALLTAFKREWEIWQPKLAGKIIESIYFGGGTPFLFGSERIAEILELIPNGCKEITLEANPETVSSKEVRKYADAGINRISLGVQSFDDALLQTLTREHGAEKAKEAIYTIHQNGISNISIDLMYELPGQTLESWDRTLNEVKKLPITHLSLYNLTFEPQTLFYKQKKALLPLVPEDEDKAEMYRIAVKKLEAAGLEQYEISAFSKEGYPSRHNLGYWTARPFIGFGPSAFSYWNGSRFRNAANFSRYSKSLQENRLPIDFEETLSRSARQRELLAVRLRLLEGVDIHAFEEAHGALEIQVHNELERLSREGFLSFRENRCSLTQKGLLFYDSVASALI